MKAMILAAGRGKRMSPLTDHCPKPLLPVAGKPLIVHHIERLRDAGITELLINAAYLADMLMERLGNGHQYGVTIAWSREEQALETAGGIRQALPLLGEEPFLLVNGDVWTDFPFSELINHSLGDDLARLVMVPNPAHNPGGDFHLTDTHRLRLDGEPQRVYSGVALMAPALVAHLPLGEAVKLLPPLQAAIQRDKVGGIDYRGAWVDVGTPERLAALDQRLAHAAP
ncbi:N-acetylmuramate alpha-1-phosphate uridylyltransferase MurU [Carnimonas nigrificans]|uniref:N-acetylmuramate alpha-1-phosphate uridylyltransferase MurU n=1 Tax=Carnimonas nigrificans TaxID=64323 RepID=UPI00046F8D7C|nr:nucleotidyltransferase family protein [Carnimonas nigrificans]